MIDQTEWRTVCPIAQFRRGEAMRSDGAPTIAVVEHEGEYFAIDDMCSHGRSSLSEGFVEGPYLECVLHATQFDVRDGRPISAPATVPVDTYETRVDDGVVYVRTSPKNT